MKEDSFKKTEATLYMYKSLDIKIKNINIDIENLENDITVKAVNFDERTASTNAFNSTVENEVIKRDEFIQEQLEILKAKLKYYKDLKIKIEGALSQLTAIERKIVELRYFNKEKMNWIQISLEINLDKNYCITVKNKIIKKLHDLIYP